VVLDDIKARAGGSSPHRANNESNIEQAKQRRFLMFGRGTGGRRRPELKQLAGKTLPKFEDHLL
jgi:hypothetical protein